MDELISIIVPVYNVEDYLVRSVNSIINQTYKNLEIILVDDGSTDSSGMICDELKKTDDRIKVYHKKNGGLSDARNYGLSKATGDIIGFVDSDDVIKKTMYEKLYLNMIKYNTKISFCTHRDIYDNTISINDAIETKNNIELKNGIISNENILKIMLIGDIFSVTACDKLYKKSLFDDVKFPLGKVAEDAFIFVDILLQCEHIAYTTEALYLYIHRNNSITTSKFSNKFFDVIEAYRKNLKLINKYFPRLNNYGILRICWAYFYVLDRLIIQDEYDDELADKLIKFLLKNKKLILRYKFFTKNRKLAFILLFINKRLYRLIVKKYWKF